MLEISVPVRSAEDIVAAVQSGADSVYLRICGGLPPELSEEDYEKSLRYCRVRGCKVYIEFDSYATDTDMAEFRRRAIQAAELGADALVLQDVGLARFLRQCLPDMPLYGGDRLGIQTVSCISALTEIGFKRLRLPAEMSAAEIEKACGATTAELEVTVFGGVCLSRRGLCYMSAMSAKSSANRGACNSMCKEPYSLGGLRDAERPLVMAQADLLEHVQQLERMGIVSLRIGESVGRSEWKALLCALLKESVRESREPKLDELGRVELAFSDRSLSDAYFMGEHDRVFETFDTEPLDSKRLMTEMRRSYETGELRRVGVEFFVLAQHNKPLNVAVIDTAGNKAVQRAGRLTESRGHSLSEGMINDAFYKTVGTPFECEAVNIRLEPNLICPPEGYLDGLRHKLLRELAKKRSQIRRVNVQSAPSKPVSVSPDAKIKRIFQISKAEQLSEGLALLGADMLYIPLELCETVGEQLELFRAQGTDIAVILPKLIRDCDVSSVRARLSAASAMGIKTAVVGNFGHIGYAKAEGMAVRGDFELGIYNSYATSLVSEADLVSFTAHPELRLSQIRNLSKPAELEFIVYGRLPVMVTEHCLLKRSTGRCKLGKGGTLSDAHGITYPIACTPEHGNIIYHSLKLYVADRHTDYESAGISATRLIFTTESERECIETAEGAIGRSGYRPNGLTRGLYYKGV